MNKVSNKYYDKEAIRINNTGGFDGDDRENNAKSVAPKRKQPINFIHSRRKKKWVESSIIWKQKYCMWDSEKKNNKNYYNTHIKQNWNITLRD